MIFIAPPRMDALMHLLIDSDTHFLPKRVDDIIVFSLCFVSICLFKLELDLLLLPPWLHTFMTNSIQYPGSCDYIIRIISQLVRWWHNSRDNVSSCHGVELLIRIKIFVTFSTIKSQLISKSTFNEMDISRLYQILQDFLIFLFFTKKIWNTQEFM